MVNLVKGQKVELTKSNPGLTKINAGLGWDVNAFDSGSQFDLDAEVFLLGDNGKVTSDGDFVFYGNTVHASGSVEHTGDNRDGVGDGAELAHKSTGEKYELAPYILRYQRGSGVCYAAQGKELIDPAALMPSYLRLPQAERERLAREGKPVTE